MTRIVIFKEKHSLRYFNADTPEDFARACASILRERYEEGWFREPEPVNLGFTKEEKEILAMHPDDIAMLPSFISDEVSQKRAKLMRRKETADQIYDMDKKWWDHLGLLVTQSSLELAAALQYTRKWKLSTGQVKQKTYALAEWLIERHADYEYEGYTIIETEEPSWK